MNDNEVPVFCIWNRISTNICLNISYFVQPLLECMFYKNTCLC